MRMKLKHRGTRNLSLAILTVAVMAAPACSKDKSESGGGSGGAAASKSALKIFPSDSEFVFSVNGAKLRKSKYYDMLEGLIKKQAGDKLAELEACGVDVMNSLQSLTVGGNTKTGKPLVKLEGVAREAFKKCAGTAEDVELKEEGEFSVLTQAGKEMVLAWLGDNTVVGGSGWSKPDLKARLTAEAGVDGNKALSEMLAKTDGGATIWFAFAPAGGKMPGRSPVDIKGVFGSVWLDSGVKVDLGARLGSEQEASDLVKQAKSQLPQAKAQFQAFATLIDKLDISSSGSDVRMKLDLSYTEVDDLIKAAKEDPMVQMMLSMAKAQIGG